jgi:uncharacterized protein (DUF58 family)
MQTRSIERKGSHLYTRAYRNLAAALTVVYMLIGAALALLAAQRLGGPLAGAILFLLVCGFVAAMWLFYLTLLWIFARESRQSVEISPEGVREMHNGREHAFIPWEGVMEIELAATVVAGASLRVKGNFSEISISNVDLTITHPMGLREMHRAVGQTRRMRELLDELRAAAPHAALRMNKLARRRLSRYEWVRSL